MGMSCSYFYDFLKIKSLCNAWIFFLVCWSFSPNFKIKLFSQILRSNYSVKILRSNYSVKILRSNYSIEKNSIATGKLSCYTDKSTNTLF